MSGEVKATGGCAFPFNAGEFGIEPSPGMSLRDWFAGQAVATLLQNTTINPWMPATYAEHAYEIADAMIAERSK